LPKLSGLLTLESFTLAENCWLILSNFREFLYNNFLPFLIPYLDNSAVLTELLTPATATEKWAQAWTYSPRWLGARNSST
jgi:hypothetical protein